MSPLTLIAILLIILILSGAIRYLMERARDHFRYREEVVKRLRSISR